MATRVDALDAFQRPHEDVKSAVGLQVARDIGEHGPVDVARPQHQAAGRGDGGLRVGPQLVGGDAFVLHADLGMKDFRMPAFLPLRWGNGHIAVRQVQRVQRVPGADACPRVEADRELGVEADVGAVGAVEPFAQMHQARIWKHILGIQRFAPTGVGHDHIGHEA